MADQAYLRDSILKPKDQIVEGYAPAMPSFEQALSAEELDNLVAYIASLSK